MPPALVQWITPAAVVAVLLYIHRSLRQDMLNLRGEIRELRGEIQSGLREATRERAALREHMDAQIGNLRDRMESQNSDLRDRLGRIEGYLDLLREFFVGSGRGTAA